MKWNHSIRELAPISVVVLLFAGNILVGKAAVPAIPPFTLALLRSIIAFTASVVCFGGPAWRSINLFRQHKGRLFIIGASGIGLFNALLYAALHTASTTSVAVLEASIPIFTAIVAWLRFQERLGYLGWAGVFVSVTGAVIVVTNGAPMGFLRTVSPGVFVMLLAIGAWIVYAMVATHGLSGLPPLAAMVPLSAAAVVTLLPLAVIEQLVLGGSGSLSPAAVGSALYLGLGPSFVAFILYNRALRTIGPTAAALSLNALPIAVLAFGYLFLHESISLPQIIGTMTVLAGVSAVIRARG
ncbi:DMT family transporter [Salinisphaera sp. SWV1]|uniref:DMT family transporter n=1 Tax=Salinisphaera sp. SWV1 TaxID=3454139 RepID=UPI003F84A302